MTKNKTDIIQIGEDLFKKAPVLPKNIRDGFIIILPWAALVIGILRVYRVSLGLYYLATVPATVGFVPIIYLGGIFAVISGVMLIMAFPQVRKELYSGWKLIFWSEIVSLVSALLLPGLLLVGVIGALITLYLLYQVKSSYK